MTKPRFITPQVLLENPGLINSIHANIPEKVDDMKERLKALRRVYRCLRDDQGLKHANILVEMKKLFPNETHILIDLAGFIEAKILYVPNNQIPRWVTVPFEAIYSLVHHALITTGDQNSTMRLLSAYLWYEFSGGDHIWTPSAVVSTSGLSEWNFKEDLENNYKIHIPHNPYKIKFNSEFRTSWRIVWNNSLPIKGITYDKVLNCTSRTRITDPPPISQNIEDEFALHHLYYPQKPFQYVDKDLPIIISDSKYATIPLIDGIIPILISYIVPKDALFVWLKQAGVPKPSKRMNSLYNNAEIAVSNLIGMVKYIRPAHIRSILTPRIQVSDYMRIQFKIMQRGLFINANSLRKLNPPTAKHKSKRKNNARRKKLSERKQRILESIYHKDGWYRGTYNLESHSERTHYRKNNIQSYPSCFKEAVEAPKGYELVYLDVQANDISILFNIANDNNGLSLLRSGDDPYQHLALIAFPGENLKTARKKVKEVVSPWLYGASATTIIKGDKLIDAAGVRAVKSAITQEFSSVTAWIKELNREVRKDYLIPAHLNPIDNLPIPMPKPFSRRVAPSLLIQRLGATIMKQAVIWLNEHSFSATKIMLTVHDSILLITQNGEGPLSVVEAIQSIKYGIQQTPSINLLVLKTGRGSTWKEAEDTATSTTCQR